MYFTQILNASERLQLTLNPEVNPKKKCIDPTGKHFAHTSCAQSHDEKWEDTTFIQKAIHFTQTLHASGRIQLTLNHEIHPKGIALITLKNALHILAMHV